DTHVADLGASDVALDIDATKAIATVNGANGQTYTLTSANAGEITMSATLASGKVVSQNVKVVDQPASGVQTLDFDLLGIKLTLTGSNANATAANFVADLA